VDLSGLRNPCRRGLSGGISGYGILSETSMTDGFGTKEWTRFTTRERCLVLMRSRRRGKVGLARWRTSNHYYHAFFIILPFVPPLFYSDHSVGFPPLSSPFASGFLSHLPIFFPKRASKQAWCFQDRGRIGGETPITGLRFNVFTPPCSSPSFFPLFFYRPTATMDLSGRAGERAGFFL
jgi:hypothetical protein